MFNYQDSKVYKIICNVTGLKFIGSTCRSLSAKLTDHKTHYKNKKNKTSAWAVLENNNFCIILIEDFPCNNKTELLEREQYYITNSVCVNKQNEDKSQKKYYIKYYVKNVEKIREQQRNYYLKRKEQIHFKKVEQTMFLFKL
jgi:hypothetical protein